VNEALKQLDAILAQSLVTTPRFPPNSRYHATPLTGLVAPDGRVVTYLRRRFVPPPERFAVLREHLVVQDDRLDRLAAHHLGDPELFWRLCDANDALRPDELTETVGRWLRITLPEGVPGAGN
jgi:hypothetical protein